ncbi:MAG: DNA replication protein DnaC [Clostridiales bacterium]|nr:DNA replication protein DnaC [Clostridiales bacterium]
MNSSILNQILKNYEKKRLLAEKDLDFRKKSLYNKYPRLHEIDTELSKLGLKTARNLLISNSNDLLTELNNKIDLLKKEKLDIIAQLNLPQDYLKANYSCKLCNDTGYIYNNYNSTMCNCLKQELYNIEYNKSNISNLENQNFDNFSFNYYSNIIDKSKYNSDISPRDNIGLIKNICLNFINNFDNPNEKNLLFTGNTGLGKTFLSSCIAKEIIQNGKTVLYQTAPIMLDTIIDYKFNKNNSSSFSYKNLLDVDLLIIDDLGTESLNNIKFSELFNIINSRLLNQNGKVLKTIISTNLGLSQLNQTYGERITSRLIGNYNICRFFGEDIRFIKNSKLKQ